MPSSQQQAVLEMFSGWKRGEFELAPVTGLLGIRPMEVGEGRAVVGMEAARDHQNAFGTMHGGLLCALADIAMGVALATVLDGEVFTTLHQQMNHVRGVEQSSLSAVAEVTQRGRRVAHLRCVIADEESRLVGEASSTCLITKLEPSDEMSPVDVSAR